MACVTDDELARRYESLRPNLDEKARRLRAVAERARMRVGADSVEGAERLGRALAGTGAQAVVEIDSGHHRTGVAPDRVVEVARAALAAAGARSGRPPRT